MLNKLISESRFSEARSTIDHKRSGFDLSHGHTMSMNAGKLYPCFFREVLPGDTFDLKDAFVNRMSTPVVPVMDTALFERWYFYIPYRLVWEHTKEFYGENNVSAWVPNREYYMPALTAGADGFKPDGVADHFGIPTLCPGLKVNALPFRAYRLTWNEYFRDQNTQDPELVNLGDVENNLSLDDLLPVNKRKDYFTTCLPAPQKGPDVFLPLGSYAPVIASGSDLTQEEIRNLGGMNAISFYLPLSQGPSEDRILYTEQSSPNSYTAQLRSGITDVDISGSSSIAVPRNLVADLSTSVAPTINQLRQAFLVQSLYELDARGGSRYREFLKVHFSVNVPDLTVQVPEFLGGQSSPLNMNQVIQTSATGVGDTPQGNAAAFSKTVGQSAGFTKSFSEPGMVIGLCSCRTLHTYTQGLEAFWSRFERLDFYHPILDGLGEMPVYNREIYAYGDDLDEVFGYQEAFGSYRYAQSYVSGAFRPNYPSGSLIYWTYADVYDSTPRLSSGWVAETDDNVARTLATTDMDGAPQFLVDLWFDFKAYRPMSAHPTPAMLGGRQ